MFRFGVVNRLSFFLPNIFGWLNATGKVLEEPIPGPSTSKPPSPHPVPMLGLGAIPKTLVAKRPHRHRPVRSKRHGPNVEAVENDARREAKKQKHERENGIIDEEQVDPTHAVAMTLTLDNEALPKLQYCSF